MYTACTVCMRCVGEIEGEGMMFFAHGDQYLGESYTSNGSSSSVSSSGCSSSINCGSFNSSILFPLVLLCYHNNSTIIVSSVSTVVLYSSMSIVLFYPLYTKNPSNLYHILYETHV